MPWTPGFEENGRLADMKQTVNGSPHSKEPGVAVPIPQTTGEFTGKSRSKLFFLPEFLSESMGVSFWFALIWVFIVVFFALTADYLPLPDVNYMDFAHQAAPPGTVCRIPIKGSTETEFVCLLGTDTLGRDIATRIISGTRVSLTVGLATPCIGLVIGGVLGMLAGFYRGRLDYFLMMTMDAILAFPALVLLLVITFCLGPSLLNITLSLGFLLIPYFTRVARANTLTLSEREFVQSARMLGQTDISIIIREITPNIIMPLIAYALLVVSYMIIAEGTLSFLGLGVPQPTPSWGGIIAEGKEVLDDAPHISLLPAFILFLTVLSFNIVGDSVKRVLDLKEAQL